MGYKSTLARLRQAEGRLPCGGEDVIINMPDRHEREKLNGKSIAVFYIDSVKQYRIAEDVGHWRDMSEDEIRQYEAGDAIMSTHTQTSP